MDYRFPPIAVIDDVLPAIEGRDEFIIAEKDGYKVINYVVVKSDTFPDPILPGTDLENGKIWQDDYAALRRECRGLIFDCETDLLIRRPYHKFFNLGEHPEVALDKINLNKPHIIMDKLDGSMIVPFILRNEVRWGTKMGITDVALPVEEFVKRNRHYEEFAWNVIQAGFSPIFEWCSPQQKIVLSQKEDRLILTAIRHMYSGKYYPIEPFHRHFPTGTIPVCPVYDGRLPLNIQDFANSVRGLENVEGYVVRFDTGHMIKVKCDWYVNVHKIKESINSERSILSLAMEGGLDDAKTLLDSEEVKRIETFTAAVFFYLEDEKNRLYNFWDSTIKQPRLSRKEFALGPALTLHSIEKALIFKLWDDLYVVSIDSAEEAKHLIYLKLLDFLKKSLTNNQDYDIFKSLMFPELDY